MGKGVKNFTFYIIMLIVFGGLMYSVIRMGEHYNTVPVISHADKDVQGLMSESFTFFTNSIKHNVYSPIALLLLQVIAILFVARIFGWFFTKIGQPSVIGEIVAGIVLGPSVLGYFLPEVSGFLFAPGSLGNINILSQIGLILFMFTIGMELDIAEVKKKFNETILISHASIVFPFFFGLLAAYWTYPKYASHMTSYLSYALFIGIAMSITAFPVLARIIQEKRLTKSHLGTIALASAANDDITAWCLLAAVIAIAQTGTFMGTLFTVLFTILFLFFMFFILKPFLKIIGNIYHNKEVLNKTVVAFLFFILIVSAYTTEIIGIHALFGAFIAGVIMPSNLQFRKILTEKVEDVALSIFLPLFFVSTGLKTQIGLINSLDEWLVCLMLIAIAIIGKVGGATLSSRVAGETWKDSLSIGALMNTRGLMELVVLTIGYEMKIIPPSIFVMLVLMTLVTTLMTGPYLNLIDFFYARKLAKKQPEKKSNKYRVLMSFGRASSGCVMLDVADQIFSKGKREISLTALHLTVGTEVNPIHIENFEEDNFSPVLEEAEQLGMNIHTRYEVTNDAGQEIVNIVNNENFDFLLVGAGISMSTLPQDVEATKYKELYLSKLGAPGGLFYPGGLLKDKTRKFIEEANSPVGIFVNRDFETATQVIILLKNAKDIFLFEYAINLMRYNKQVEICVLELGESIAKNKLSESNVREFLNEYKETLFVRSSRIPFDLLLKRNFMLISYNTWNEISEDEKDILHFMPSTLIVNKK